MKAAFEDKGLDAGALQLDGKRLKLPSYIGQGSLTQLRLNDTIPFDAELESIHREGKRAKLLVGRFKTIQNTGVVALIESFGAEQNVEVFEAFLHFQSSRFGRRVGRNNGWGYRRVVHRDGTNPDRCLLAGFGVLRIRRCS